MNIDGSIALVTGANRGLGRVFARALLEQGARTVYGGARESSTIEDPDLVPLWLDVTDPASVAHAADQLTEIDIVINNAGVATWSFPLDAQLEDARRELEVNYLACSQSHKPSRHLLRGAAGALSSTCCPYLRSSPLRASAPTRHPKRRPGRSPTPCVSSCASKVRW